MSNWLCSSAYKWSYNLPYAHCSLLEVVERSVFFWGGTYQITLCLTGYLKPLQVDRCDVASTTPLMLTSSWQKLKKSTAVSLGIREPPPKTISRWFQKKLHLRK